MNFEAEFTQTVKTLTELLNWVWAI